MEGNISDNALRLRSAQAFDFAQGPSTPLRAGKIRSLSGAEAPDFREKQDFWNCLAYKYYESGTVEILCMSAKESRHFNYLYSITNWSYEA